MQRQEQTNKQKKEYARILFMNTDLTQKEIAEKVGTSPNSMSAWVREGNWDMLKTTLSITKENQLRSLYEQLQLLNEQNKLAITDGDPNTNPDYDELCKLVKSIERLEKEDGMGATYKILMDFLTFTQRSNLEHAQILNNYADAFIKERLNHI